MSKYNFSAKRPKSRLTVWWFSWHWRWWRRNSRSFLVGIGFVRHEFAVFRANKFKLIDGDVPMIVRISSDGFNLNLKFIIRYIINLPTLKAFEFCKCNVKILNFTWLSVFIKLRVLFVFYTKSLKCYQTYKTCWEFILFDLFVKFLSISTIWQRNFDSQSRLMLQRCDLKSAIGGFCTDYR